jgi:predicted aminopeptidase
MTRFIVSGFVAAFFAAAMLMPAPASAGPAGVANPAEEASLVQEAGYYKKRRWWRSNGYDTDVDAPTTSVRTNDAYTDVDAPFTSVRKSPGGTWVRAPFVNLFVPRD